MGILSVVKDHEWVPYFDKAFQLTVNEIRVDHELSQEFKGGLFQAFVDGDNRIGEDIAKRYLLPETWRWIGQHEQPEYQEAIKQFVHRLTMRVYEMKRREEFLKNVDDRPYWMFEAMPHAKCRRYDGKVYRYDSQFWKRDILPCNSKECGCRIRALDEEYIKSKGIKVSRA